MLFGTMKTQIGVIASIVVALGLLIGLIVVKNQAAKQQTSDAQVILTYSNKWVDVDEKLGQQKEVNATLESDLAKQKNVLGELTNNFTKVAGDLAQVNADLAKTEATLKASREEVTKLTTKINDLESQNQQLDKQATDLSTAITNLTGQISETERKLSASEGDKAFLQKELKRLMVEKAELEKQFNDLAILRAQVAKLKEELNISRRIEWIRQGLFASADQKGAQKLMQGFTAAQTHSRATNKPAYDLNVEINADGTVKVIPPLTNAPAGHSSTNK